MSIVTRARYMPGGCVQLSFPYDPGLIAVLKKIPPTSRTFDRHIKTWTVRFPWQDRAVSLLFTFFPDAECIRTSSHQVQGTTGRLDDAFAQLHLQPSAPPELIDAAYRVLAKRHHPDAGGETAVMQRLNGAYTMLKERVHR